MIQSMKPNSPADIPILLFGAFDRHNFGDLLFPHVAAALLPGRKLIFAGLAERDLRPYGGHQVRALSQLALELGNRPLNILHVGGELLTCDAWQAAVMLQSPGQAQDIIARLDAHETARKKWAQGILGIGGLAPYAVARQLFPGAASVMYNGVGGVDLASRTA
ncbi:MAG: chromosome condensation regulator RCC1, partial [Nitrosomonadales bacterium]